LIDGRYLLVGNGGDKFCGDFPEINSQAENALFAILPYHLAIPESEQDRRWVVFDSTDIVAPPELENLSLDAYGQQMGGGERYLDGCLSAGRAIHWIKLRVFLEKQRP